MPQKGKRQKLSSAKKATGGRTKEEAVAKSAAISEPQPRVDDPGDPGDIPLPDFSLAITSPANNAALRPNTSFTVRGTTTRDSNVTIGGVGVRLGTSGDFTAATPGSGGNWSSWSFSSTVPSGSSPLQITASMSVTFPGGSGSAQRSVSIIVDGTQPNLTNLTVAPSGQVTGPGPTFPITVSGNANDNDKVSAVDVRVGSGSFVRASGASDWSQWEKPVVLQGTGPHDITARATDRAGNTKDQPITVTAVDTAPPALRIDSPEEDPKTLTWSTDGASFDITGAATDPTSGVDVVEWRLDSDEFQPAENESGDWSRWRARVAFPHSETFTFEVRARDGAGNATTATVTFIVAEPLDLEDTSPSAYFQDLLAFAERRVKTPTEAEQPDRQLFAETFHQNFGRLIEAATADIATRPVAQVRICIEVLRSLLAGQAAPDEAQYREAAYYALLQNLGTSYEEIRLARAADDAARAALAGRLGMELDPLRPDALDRLFLPPERLADAESEADLETVFGLRDTRGDPLQEAAPADLLTLRREGLRRSWRKQDQEGFLGTEIPVPVIDPDLLTAGDLKNATPGNAAFDAFQERQVWVTDTLSAIQAAREAQSTSIEGFDHIVNLHLEAIDLEALAQQREQGEDVDTQLNARSMSLQAFLQLLRIRRLAAVETVLDDEWAEVYAILLQVRKQRDKYAEWREEERASGLTLGPDHFRVAPDDGALAETARPPHWRTPWRVRRAWERTLEARIAQESAVNQSLRSAIAATEAATLPLLRDMLVVAADPVEEGVDAANWLTRRLQIDVKTGGDQQTTHIHQAIETLQGMLFSLRTGRLKNVAPLSAWDLDFDADYGESHFDQEWKWLGKYELWRAAMFVFGYPENYLLPALRETPLLNEDLAPTQAFVNLVGGLRGKVPLKPGDARRFATDYMDALRGELGAALPSQLGAEFELTELLSDEAVAARRDLIEELFGLESLPPPGETGMEPYKAPPYLQEVFFFVPLQIALQLQRSGQYLTALDWFRTVYAYDLPLQPEGERNKRKIYYGLVLEEALETRLQRPFDWLLNGLNPHEINAFFSPRANAYTRFTLMSLVRCVLDFADAEFTQATKESIPRARALYLTALELLDHSDMRPPVSVEGPDTFPANPVPESMRRHAEMNLFKLRSGRNIAGMERQSVLEVPDSAVSDLPVISGGQIRLPAAQVRRPTPYRYSALVERGKELVGLAQQMEAAFLSALEKRDAEAYTRLQAGHDLQLAGASVDLQVLRLEEADSGIELATLQQDRAQIQKDTFQEWIDEGLNKIEKRIIDKHREAAKWRKALAAVDTGLTVAQAAASASGGGLFGSGVGGAWASVATITLLAGLRGAFSNVVTDAETAVQINSLQASHERRKDEWELQKGLADKDIEIGLQQIFLAENQKQIADQEHEIAGLQADQAALVADFLANKFTNAELYEWMSGILGRIYNYFLQQATAMAQLAQSQLAFERQETSPSFIQADYWELPMEAGSFPGSNDEEPDRRGLTGSARLLQDIFRLDQHAFETRKRKLQLTQSFSLLQLAPFEFQQFRETGILPFATPMELFNQGFPGHYLRLIKRLRLSIVALVPPSRGVRAMLRAAGVSRVVTAGEVFREVFQSVVVRRDPELIAFTSPVNASGLFELEPEGELLLPFEGMGVDTSWELELPKAANPFDFRSIADVLVTVEYTALYNAVHREQVVRELDRSVSAERSFSFRQEFADAFYDLNNPDQSDAPMAVRFETRREDFPPNIDELAIQHIVMFFARGEGVPIEVPVTHLHFTTENDDAPVGGGATSIDGVISTRRGNAGSWVDMIGRSPVGTWELAFPDTEEIRSLFDSGRIDDILFVVTYSGRTPSWPNQL